MAHDDIVLPALLRAARGACAGSIRTSLAARVSPSDRAGFRAGSGALADMAEEDRPATE